MIAWTCVRILAPYDGPWHRAGWWVSQVDVRPYQEGTLAIDVFDVRGRQPVWHGSGKKELSQSDIEHSEAVIRDAVTAVLASFLPKEM